MQKCGYGCEKEGVFPPTKGRKRWCCEESFTKCPGFIYKANKKKKNRTFEELYGYDKARELKINLSNKMKKNNPMYKMEVWNKGKRGVYSDETIKKMKMSAGKNKGETFIELYGDKKATELKKNLSINMKKTMTGRKPWNKNKKGCFSSNTIKLMGEKATERMKSSKVRNNIKYKLKLSCKEYRKRWNFLFVVEELKDGPNKNFYARCKNHNCPNSKEKGGWFLTSRSQLDERRNEVYNGNGGSYLYCSQECKYSCPLWNLKKDPFDKPNKKEIYNYEEYQTFRQFVLKRDIYECQYCNEKAEHVHHERPQKLEPFFSLDPDLAWSVCSKCHYKKGHKDECSTVNISRINCEEY